MQSEIILKEQIQDNFYYAEYHGSRIIFDKDSKYFNATKLCFFAFKNYKDWRQHHITRFLFDLVEKYTMKDQELYIESTNNQRISGVYLHIYFLKFISEWLTTDSDISGYIYVISTEESENNNLYMIGSAKNFVRKMSEINKHIKFGKKFYTVLLYESYNAKLLETKIHVQLKDYKTKNEFFMCNLNIIEEKFSAETCIKIYPE